MQMSQCFAWGGRMSRRVLGKKVSRTTAQQKVRMLQRLPWLPAFSYSSFPLSPRHVMEALNGTSSLLKQPSKTTRKLGHSCFGKMVGGKETSLGAYPFFFCFRISGDWRFRCIPVMLCSILYAMRGSGAASYFFSDNVSEQPKFDSIFSVWHTCTDVQQLFSV